MKLTHTIYMLFMRDHGERWIEAFPTPEARAVRFRALVAAQCEEAGDEPPADDLSEDDLIDRFRDYEQNDAWLDETDLEEPGGGALRLTPEQASILRDALEVERDNAEDNVREADDLDAEPFTKRKAECERLLAALEKLEAQS